MKPRSTATLLLVMLLPVMGSVIAPASSAQQRNGLILTQTGIEKIRADLGNVPLFDASLQRVQQAVDAEILMGMDIPIPRDLSGGYTHERHKRNFYMLQQAGVLFQLLEDEKYADYVRDMLLQYAAMYQDLPLHPQTRSYARGKLFWQCLNDANWLVYTSQAYDAIHDWLSESERNQLEHHLFRPFADHISIKNPQFFNRIHNHSTWGIAAVGMIGLVMEDQELIDRALYGLADDGLHAGAKDDDGGFIRVAGQQAGFFANLDEPFSPDGYYTEGPYYQRYAMYPFLLFAQALHNARPELGVFEYKQGVLLKAVNVLLNVTDADGEFFPINDAQKGMSYRANELVAAVNIAYHYGNQDPRLLSIAAQQGRVLLDDSGHAVAAALRDGLARPFVKTSANYSDGTDGDQGGLALLRYGEEQLTLLFKYSAQGLSHGHYDKLAFSLHAQGEEILQDYGMARFVNVGQKGGGNYLPENTSWAKQTIAHNTLIQNETSHFGGLYEVGSQHHSKLHFFDATDANVQVVSAKESNAYPGTIMQRTMAVIKETEFDNPFILDLFRTTSATANQYDLPFYYLGQIMDTSFDLKAPATVAALGADHGYQHLYLEAIGLTGAADNTRFSWLHQNRFYTLTTVTEPQDQILLVRIGANDPGFNLRRDPAIIVRRPEARDTLFASIIEPHGSYDPVTELALDASSRIAGMHILHNDTDYSAVSIKTLQGKVRIFIVANQNAEPHTVHSLEIGGQPLRWTGPFHYATW